MSEEEKNKQGGQEHGKESNIPKPQKESYIGENLNNQEDLRKGAEIPPRPRRPTKRNNDNNN